MKPTEELMHDHTIIMHMLDGAEKMALAILDDGSVDVGKVKDVVEFSRNFTDGCHHSKEEKVFFPRLEERGMPSQQGPVAVMLHEHSVGRALIGSIEEGANEYEAGNKDAAMKIAQAMLQYVELLRDHIAKENNILFPMSDRFLSAEDQKSLEESFKFIEEHEVGAEVHERYHRMAHDIAG